MRWSIRAGVVLALLLVVYTVWPFVDLYRLARAVENRDVVELSRRIELRGVRPSVTRQILATYLALTGKDAGLGTVGREMAIGLGTAAAQPALADLVSVERVAELFAAGWPRDYRRDTTMGRFDFVPKGLGGLWKLYARSEYRLQDFYVYVPPAAPPKDAFRLRLQLVQWTWKLYAVDLPEDLRVRLAQEMIKATEKK